MASPRRKLKNAPPHPDSPTDREREYHTLALAFGEAEGFALFLSTYDDPRRRDELIDRLSTEQRANRLLVTRLDLSDSGRDITLLNAVRRHLTATEVPEGWRHAVMVVELERLLDYRRIGPDADGLAVLQDANLQRDAFPRTCPVPVVVWLSPIATSVFAQAAPDLWHWRAATFDFTGGPERRLEVLASVLDDRPFEQDRASYRRLEERVALLKELLLEFDRTASESADQHTRRGYLLADLAATYLLLHRCQEALQAAADQLAIARAIGDRRLEGAALNLLGLTYAALDESRRAIEFHKQGRAIAREIGDRRGEASALANLGNAYDSLGEPRRAIKLYEQGLTIAREIGDRRVQAGVLDSLGLAYRRLGKPRRAIEFCEQELAIAREIGDRRVEASALYSLGNAYWQLREWRRAIELYEQVLAIEREIGDRLGAASMLRLLGSLYLGLGEPRRAIEFCEQELAIAREIGDRHVEALAMFNSGLALYTLGDRGRAIACLRAALDVEEAIASPMAEQTRAMLAKWGAEELARLPAPWPPALRHRLLD